MRALPAPAGEGLQGQRRTAGLPPQGRPQVRSRRRCREGPPPPAAPLRPRRCRRRGRVSRRIRHRDLLQGALRPGPGPHCQPPGLRRGGIRLRPPPPHRVHCPRQVPHGPVQEPRHGQLGLLPGRRRVGPHRTPPQVDEPAVHRQGLRGLRQVQPRRRGAHRPERRHVRRAVHAPVHVAAPLRPQARPQAEALGPPPVRTLPQGCRPVHGGIPPLLPARVRQDHDGRAVQQELLVQHPPHVR
mmetsp:Transcript_20196/g.57927  ORF Transcript_20196/g.57927 Transcript_20196/m.57927 type:complete len:242 (+) Transcript_20196:543-1268(+)